MNWEKNVQTRITLVVAMNQERVIGVNNQLPWHIPEDLAYFKKVTLGKPIIMGRKTFESIGRVLPGRRNIVISRNLGWHHDGVEVCPSVESALALCTNNDEVCIIGGGEIFKQTLAIADCLHITLVDVKIDTPTAFFPQLELDTWERVHNQDIISQNGIKCSFNEYIRK
jgi:dihydrofolate reductase